MDNISKIRTDYNLNTLEDKNVLENPFNQFEKWFKEALEINILEINAMALSTYDIKTNMPNTRIVLLKEFDTNGFTFFTNYNSKKGKEIETNNNACILFFWKELQRQVKIQGIIKKTSVETSINYFDSRPLGSRISALASNQSNKIENREILENKYKILEKKYLKNVPKPENWGGYILEPILFEFWQGRASRLHDRICYEKESKTKNVWNKYRLEP